MFRKIFFIFLILFFQKLKAATILLPPNELETRELNKEEREKFQNVNYKASSNVMPEQYRGELKYKEGFAEARLKDVRFFFGFGGRATFANSTNMNVKEMSNPRGYALDYYSPKHTWEYDVDYNYFLNFGIYWVNGIRIEFEYSSIVLETNNYGKDFDRYPNGIIFNQYLQDGSTLTNVDWLFDNGGGIDLDFHYTTLTGNMAPLVEFRIKTYMLNFIFEKVRVSAKFRPYVGFGVGLVAGDMRTLVNTGESKVPGGQIMIGFSYPMNNEENLVLYLGYRFIYAKEMEQQFTRIVGVSTTDVENDVLEAMNDMGFDGNMFLNPKLVTTKETYQFRAQNVDLGFRFYF